MFALERAIYHDRAMTRWSGGARLTATLVATLVIACGQGGTPSPSVTAGGGEIFLEPISDPGPDPFTPPVIPTSAPSAPATPDTGPTRSPVVVGPGPVLTGPPVVQSSIGGKVGLYGGSRNRTECEIAQFIAFLEAEADKGAAWAAVHDIDPGQIRDYIERLTPVTLEQDTRVTNHGYKAGVADPRQSVLQDGTAVLVDDRGVPRARCACGNPLLEPVPVPTTPTLRGQAWPGFSAGGLSTITPAPAPLARIPVIDPGTGTVFERPIGTTGGEDVPTGSTPQPSSIDLPSPAASSVSLPGPGAGQPVARGPLVPSDMTGIGAVEANSIDPNYPIGGAVDIDLTTSWFSKGPHTPATVTTYEWSVSGPIEIGAIVIVGNGANSTPQFRTGFGFEQVRIEVLRDGVGVATASGVMSGTDPRILAELPPGTMGDSVRLSFTGHESLDCGGIGELLVLGPDWAADQEMLTTLGYS